MNSENQYIKSDERSIKKSDKSITGKRSTVIKSEDVDIKKPKRTYVGDSYNDSHKAIGIKRDDAPVYNIKRGNGNVRIKKHNEEYAGEISQNEEVGIKRHSKLIKRTKNNIKSLGKNIKSSADSAISNQNDENELIDMEDVRGVRKVTATAMAFAQSAVAFVVATVKILGSNLILILILGVSAFIIVTVGAKNATYDFVVDEEEHTRELMSNITYEFSCEIEAKKLEYECDMVVSSGKLADWKEIIALWWTLKNYTSDSAQWESHFTSDDQQNLEYIFWQFNHVEYTSAYTSEQSAANQPTSTGTDAVEEAESPAKGKKMLQVKITNTSLEDLIGYWALTPEQIIYLNSLIEDEEIWEELLGATELSRIAYAEIGNSASKYQQWYDDETIEKSNVFVAYCLGQHGLISEQYIQVNKTADEFKTQLQAKGFYRYKGNYEASEGNIIFLNINNELRTGIITRVDDADNLYITMCGYQGHTMVEEISISRTSGMIDGYANLGGYYVSGLFNNQGAENVINVALEFVGVTDDGNNNVIFNTDYYGHEVSGEYYPWCCAFVWDVFRMAGCGPAFYNGGKTADCEVVLAWANQDDLIIPTELVQPGDLVLFDWDHNEVPNHIGIAYQINENGSIVTIEGNTGYGSIENNGNGGAVMIRTRNDIFKVIRPEY